MRDAPRYLLATLIALLSRTSMAQGFAELDGTPVPPGVSPRSADAPAKPQGERPIPAPKMDLSSAEAESRLSRDLPRSTIEQALAGRLAAEASVLVGKAFARGNDLVSSAATEVAVSFVIPDWPYPGDLAPTVIYRSEAVAPNLDPSGSGLQQTYLGHLESFQVGAKWQLPLRGSRTVIAFVATSLGLAAGRLTTHTSFASERPKNIDGFVSHLELGSAWKFSPAGTLQAKGSFQVGKIISARLGVGVALAM